MDHKLEAADTRRLLGIARAAVEYGCGPKPAMPQPQPLDTYPEALRQIRGSFVTLKIGGQLRGCIGTLKALRPLAEDVMKNAVGAAFRDPRFPPVVKAEAADLHFHISVLSPQSALDFDRFEQLLDFLQPGTHGLVLAHGNRRATYLPSVWDLIPDKRAFVEQLCAKAGIPSNTPPQNLEAWTYTVQAFGEPTH